MQFRHGLVFKKERKMSSVNKVILIGHLGDAPICTQLQSGTSVAQFSIATNEKWKGKNGESIEKTEWHNIVVWGKMSEHCAKYLSKGSKAYIEGRLETKQWEDKETGAKRYKTQIVATQVVFLDSKKDQSEEKKEIEIPDVYEDDIPF